MNRSASPSVGFLILSRLAAGFAATALIACVAAVFFAGRSSAQGPDSPSDADRLVGKWSGQTAVDGQVTVNLTADGQLSYAFTGGEKDHGYGQFEVRTPGTILYTPHEASDAEHWTYAFDSAGRLKLKMEEDDPKDVEEYTLSRVDR